MQPKKKEVLEARSKRKYSSLLLTFGMEVDTADGTIDLVEADVVESLEAGAKNLAYTVIWDEKGFFPPHEDIFALVKVLVVEFGFFGLLCKWSESGEAGPVLHVSLVSRTPGWMMSPESVAWPNDLALEVGGQGGVIFSQACKPLSGS